MTSKAKSRFPRLSRAALAGIVMVACAVISSSDLRNVSEKMTSPLAMIVPSRTAAQKLTNLERTALRLQRRIARDYKMTVGFASLTDALKTRRTLQRASVTLRLQREGEQIEQHILLSAQAYPLWIKPEARFLSFAFSLDEDRIRESLEQAIVSVVPVPVDSRILSVGDAAGVHRVTVDRIAEPGFTVDIDGSVNAVTRSILQGEGEVHVLAAFTPGRIVNETDRNIGSFELLSSGRSTFAGSGEGRKSNVRKGIESHVNNVLVAPGETFSFNKILGNMGSDPGWQMALGIFNGTELRPVHGGGICQVATTVYRAVLNAGLPVLQRANHSLFVTYYEKYGLGIDATIFPGAQDLTFRNDTPGYLLIQAHIENEDAIVRFYGTRDGRSVALRGPYLTTNAPADLLINGRPLKTNEIAWVQDITYPGGQIEQHSVVSRYNSVPKRLKQEYALASL